MSVRAQMAIALMVGAFAVAAEAKVSRIPFDQLVRHSHVIVLAQVEEVSVSPDGGRWALANVTRVLKGEPGTRIKIWASRGWSCDITKAVKGETALFFLRASSKENSYSVMHSGRGRMPVRWIDGRRHVDIVVDDVWLPASLPIVRDVSPHEPWLASADILEVQRAILHVQSEQKFREWQAKRRPGR